MLDAFIEDINDKIKNYDKYEYSFLNKYSDLQPPCRDI